MQKTYSNPIYPYRKSADQEAQQPVHHPVIIIGAGPCGMAAALDLAKQGQASIILDDNNTVSVGSRAICFSKRTLEIMDRYGCAQPMVEKGVTWQKGKVFFKQEKVYEFDLLPESGHKLPAFINLQQYYFEEYMVNQIAKEPLIDLRWMHKLVELDSSSEDNQLKVETEEGVYALSCDYLLVADGANSKIRTELGLESKGQVFQDRFLIADVVMKADFPTERWFWFDPEFHPNQSVLLHKQADDVWRIDFQLGWDADPEEEKQEAKIRPRIEAMLGKDVEFELEWASVYTFQCRKMDDFIHNRVIFMGDAAHQVSPFGARGANGGVQSVENLSWKLARVLKGQAPATLIESYNEERQHGAAENILNSTRATDFITPKNDISRVFRDETLRLAKHYPFARSLVNSGRLSMPCDYQHSSLITKSSALNTGFDAGIAPGFVCLDAPIRINGKDSWLLEQLGNRFVLLYNGEGIDNDELKALAAISDDLVLLDSRELEDKEGMLAERYCISGGQGYLIRPDQYVAAKFKQLNREQVNNALQRALGYQSAQENP
ncbi:FAD-dependent oxidoreductase [uncultured Pseudoteredinibacter sp.]|uniref:FAD-dependent oxidoreductase n=1 Tax=uncultured Pseudoteredinibacter sp. TaxID=1641701 RepID=UPI0026246AE7|nr:FAD-dependent oxidoreductase [uncultured Pseudoteredinibacter sp.]